MSAPAGREEEPSWVTMIGAHPFEPNDATDHGLADSMLERVSPAVRRVLGRGDRWLIRGIERWHVVDDLSGRIVKECVRVMPRGDNDPVMKDAEPTPGQLAAKLRKRLVMSTGASGVATAIRASTAGGRHPLVVDLADLDQAPEVLWAGGWPWDLRASVLEPVVAAKVDPYGPHLKSAGYFPDPLCPFPMWTAFVETVWPDRNIREYALNVISVGLTGYSNGAVPLLFGPEGSGKSSVNGFVLRLLGNYGMTLKHDILTPQCPPHMYADLLSMRYAVLDEAPPTSKSGTEQFKSLTGGIPLRGAPKYGHALDIPATWTLAMTSNATPDLDDPAVVRRLRLIPCDSPKEKVRDAWRALHDVFETEAPGILSDLMRRAARWLADPSITDEESTPAAVAGVMADLRAEHDHVSRWLTTSGEVAQDPAGYGTELVALHRALGAWWTAQGLDERARPGTKGLAVKLTAAGFPGRKHPGGRRSRALRLTGHVDRPAATWQPTGLTAWSPGPSQP